MKVIRCSLLYQHRQVVDLPMSSQVLGIEPCPPDHEPEFNLLVLAPQLAPNVPFVFWIVGTGQTLPSDAWSGMEDAAARYIGSVGQAHLFQGRFDGQT